MPLHDPSACTITAIAPDHDVVADLMSVQLSRRINRLLDDDDLTATDRHM
jgi:hypothetical protein